jgi:dolichyl-phosphate-mannose-protein mannosyltransferase
MHITASDQICEKVVVRRQRRKSGKIIVAACLGVITLALLLFRIGKPDAMYYDEGYFVPEARALLTGIPNPHPYVPPLARPPFGKLLIAAGIKIAGDDPVGWRVVSAVAGALTVMAVYVWTNLLLDDSGLALAAAALTLFDNFLFVMSRIAMMDAFFVAFLMWSIVAFTAALTLEAKRSIRRILVCCAGVLIGLAGACKWNAVDTLFVYLLIGVGIPLVARLVPKASARLARTATRILEIGLPSMFIGFVIAPFVSYSLTYLPLCWALHKPFGLHELVVLNRFIWRFSTTEISNGAIASPWYSWPLGWPVDLGPQRALSYLVGNPVVAWGGLLAVGFCAWRVWRDARLAELLVILLFAANFLQWAVTPEHGLFYYYYYPCVVILGVAIVVALNNLPRTFFGVRVAALLVIAALVIFLWCYPTMAHLPAPWDCALGCWS